MTQEPQWEPWMQAALDVVKEKFINERVNGFNHPESGEYFGPVSRAKAEARWHRAEPKFRQLIMANPQLRKKFSDPEEAWKSGEPISSDEPKETGSTVPVEQQSTKMMPGVRSWNVSQDELLKGMHQLTYDDILDLWQKAKTLPEPDRQKAIRYITHLSTRLESKPSQMLVNILLETQF